MLLISVRKSEKCLLIIKLLNNLFPILFFHYLYMEHIILPDSDMTDKELSDIDMSTAAPSKFNTVKSNLNKLEAQTDNYLAVAHSEKKYQHKMKFIIHMSFKLMIAEFMYFCICIGMLILSLQVDKWYFVGFGTCVMTAATKYLSDLKHFRSLLRDNGLIPS